MCSMQDRLAGPPATAVAPPPARAGVTHRCAVLGSPISHSLSPVLHGAAYDQLGLSTWAYDRIECDEARLPALVDALGPEWVGLSLTMPLKRVVLTVADRVSPLARDVGAANTLLLGPDGYLADNTDVAGLVGALHETGVDTVETAVILGAGGTAQASLAVLRELGARQITVMVRNPRRTVALRETADRLGVELDVVTGWPATRLTDADLIISTLPGDAADQFSTHAWRAGTALLDVVYAPWPTRLAAAAQVAGCRVVGGLSVLLHQAVAQVELMTDAEAPVEAMRSALLQAVDPS
jgi:shikimate dehydrogenase